MIFLFPCPVSSSLIPFLNNAKTIQMVMFWAKEKCIWLIKEINDVPLWYDLLKLGDSSKYQQFFTSNVCAFLYCQVMPPLQLKVTGNGGVWPPKVVDIELCPLKSAEQPHSSHKIALEWSWLHKDWMTRSLVSLLELCVSLPDCECTPPSLVCVLLSPQIYIWR